MAPRSKTILLVDNEENYLRPTRLALEQKLPGFEITSASTYEEALRLLQTGWYHLAVIDKRMRSNWEDDLSGFELLNQAPHAVVKILNTLYQDPYQDTLAVAAENYRATNVVDIAYKREDGDDGLVKKILAAFEQHVQLNWDLSFAPTNETLMQQMSALLPPHWPVELEDLLRMAFVDYADLNLSQILWREGNRVAVKAQALRRHHPERSFLLVISSVQVAREEREDFDRYFQETGPLTTQLFRHVETSHLGANGYSLAGVHDLGKLMPLSAAFQIPAPAIRQAVQGLLDTALPAWPLYPETAEEPPCEWYCRQLGLPPADEFGQALAEPVKRLVQLLAEKRIATIRLVGIGSANAEMEVSLPGVPLERYPHPLRFLRNSAGCGLGFAQAKPYFVHYAPRTISDENLLTDLQGRVWLTDFLGAGRLPALWIPAQLEAALLFDWPPLGVGRDLPLQDRHALQRWVFTHVENFAASDLPLGEPAQAIPTGVMEYWKAIQLVRQWAAPALQEPLTAGHPQNYYVALFYQAASRVCKIAGVSTNQIGTPKLVAAGQALLAMGLLAARLVHLRMGEPALPLPADLPIRGLYHHQETGQFYANRQSVELNPGEDYRVLLYLYDHRSQICSKDEIVMALGKGIGDKIREKGMVEASIHRLRDRIQEACGQELIITYRGRGYRVE